MTEATKNEVFAEIKRHGATRVRVPFSGGNDEGGADELVFVKDDEQGNEQEVARFDAYQWGDSEPDGLPNAIREALQAPIEATYGGFAGAFEVSGELVWDAVEHTVRMFRQETAWAEQPALEF